jgi:hypothetical protein
MVKNNIPSVGLYKGVDSMGVSWQSNIPQFIHLLNEEMKKESDRRAKQIYDDSQATCPVDTGFLKASGYISSGTAVVTVGYSAPYAIHVDFNTGFFRNALLLNERDFMGGYIQAINRAIGGLK